MNGDCNLPEYMRELAETGLTYRGDEVEATPEEELKGRFVKFNIPNPETPGNLNGEGIWGLVNREDVAKYNDDSYFGKLTVILANDSWTYDCLCRGVEVIIRCNGASRPILDPDWVKENLFNTGLVNVEGETS